MDVVNLVGVVINASALDAVCHRVDMRSVASDALRANMKRASVAMYVKDTLQYKTRPDLEVFIEGEFETICIKTTNTNKNTVVGSIYRRPNTNIALSIQRFENIFNN